MIAAVIPLTLQGITAAVFVGHAINLHLRPPDDPERPIYVFSLGIRFCVMSWPVLRTEMHFSCLSGHVYVHIMTPSTIQPVYPRRENTMPHPTGHTNDLD
jgi:hypothetical protein